MLKSMTGYGCSERACDDQRIRVEMRSVNQRFLDVQIKAPRTMLQVEDKIRKLIESVLARGRVTVYIEWKSAADEGPAVNIPAARELVRQLRLLGEELSLPGEINLSIVTRFPQLFEQGSDQPGADEVWSSLEPVLSEALDGLVAMRDAEGAELKAELEGRLDAIEDIVATLVESSPGAAAVAKERLTARITALLDGSVPVDETRLAQEVAVAAERADFTEETVRLGAHVAQSRECLSSDEPVGKRFNFLVQEMLREANTIGSKGGDIGVTGPVLSLKEEIEKLREQVQNVE
ncbi:MAG: YicC/YloC family endoribonuclease [Candidatus Eisenbacteria bacterium]